MCEAFVEFSQRNTRHKVVQEPEKKRDCDKQREDLQKAFEKAYKETRMLKEATRKRTVDETCFTTAEAVKTAELVPLVSQRDIAVEKIEVASQAIAAIDPVLNLVKEKAEKLRIHIDETLSPECLEAGDASKVLVKVRELIISLDECPGRNDFKLKIPPVEEEPEEPTKEEPPAEAPAEEPPAEEPTKAPEEPTKEEPPAEEEPAKEEPAKEEPAPEETTEEGPEDPTEAPAEAPEDPTEAPEEAMMQRPRRR